MNGGANTAVGWDAMGGFSVFTVESGTKNAAIGVEALSDNSSGNNNTASGYYALYSNSSGSFNVATGSGAMM